MADAKGADLSHWQTDAAFAVVLGWADFVIIKACTGTSPDPEFDDSDDHRWPTLKARVDSGDLVARGAYNFMVGGNGTVEADATLDIMGAHGESAFPLADFEDPRATYDELLAMGKRWEAKEGRKNGVYGGAKLKELSFSQRQELARYFWLHLADWSAPYTTIAPWPGYTLLQYVGIGLDLDEFAGDRAAMAAFFGTPATPKPPKSKEDDLAWLIQL